MEYDPFNIERGKTKLDFMSEDTIKRAAAPIRLELPKEFKFVMKRLGPKKSEMWWFIKNPTLGDVAPVQVLYFAPQGKSKLKQWFKAIMKGEDPWEGIITPKKKPIKVVN